MFVAGEEPPSLAGLVDDVVVAVEHGVGEFVAAQILPDVFGGVEFGSVRRQGNEGDVVGDGESGRAVIAGSVAYQGGMAAGCDPPRDLGEMQGHGLRVGLGQDKRRRHGARRADGAEQIGPLVAPVARRARAGSAPGPDAGQGALLADAGFVLEPDFQRLVPGMLRQSLEDRRGEVFLKASWACGSLRGCRGRTESRR